MVTPFEEIVKGGTRLKDYVLEEELGASTALVHFQITLRALFLLRKLTLSVNINAFIRQRSFPELVLSWTSERNLLPPLSRPE